MSSGRHGLVVVKRKRHVAPFVPMFPNLAGTEKVICKHQFVCQEMLLWCSGLYHLKYPCRLGFDSQIFHFFFGFIITIKSKVI